MNNREHISKPGSLAKVIRTRPVGKVQDNELLWIKRAIWAYMILLIFEGALRKWILPGLATPLLIIRDPIALWLLFAANKKGLFVSNGYITGMMVLGTIGIFTAVAMGHGNLAVAIFGARILMIHFPLIFVIGRVFTHDDIIKVGTFILWLAIPMAMLITVQLYSPQSAFVNRGVGGDEAGAGFSGSGEFLRAPGTFSFTNGVTLFFGFTSIFVIYFWLHVQKVNKLLLIAATAALIAAIPISISRGLFFQVILTVIFALVASSRKPEYFGKMMIALAGAVVGLAILSNTSFFQTAVGAFTNRFDTANEVEGGLEGVFLDRYLGGMIGALQNSANEPFFGYGLGMGTNVGSMLLGGEVAYLISEGEWGRLIGEMGPLMGITVIFIRLALCLKITVASYKKLAMGDLLPWLLLAFCLTNLPQGQWAQPTALGFSIIIGGLILASFKGPGKRNTVAMAPKVKMHPTKNRLANRPAVITRKSQ